MNLGEVVPLSEDEERLFRCHDRNGRVVRGLYAAPVSSAVSPNAFCSRMCTLRDSALLCEGHAVRMIQTAGEVSAGRALWAQDHVRAGCMGGDFYSEDACCGRTHAGGIIVAQRSKKAPASRRFESEVAAWHRPRVLAARALFEEADRMYRKGCNPGERSYSKECISDDWSDVIAGRMRPKKCSSGKQGCGGTWAWRVELRKRARLQSMSVLVWDVVVLCSMVGEARIRL